MSGQRLNLCTSRRRDWRYEAQKISRRHWAFRRSTSEVYYRDTSFEALLDDESHSEPIGRDGTKEWTLEPRRRLSLHRGSVRQKKVELETHPMAERTLHPLEERWKELMVLLEEVHLHHKKIKSELQDWQRYREASTSSRLDFLREAQSLQTATDGSSRTVSLRTLYQRIVEDETLETGCVHMIVNDFTQLEALEQKMTNLKRGVEYDTRNIQHLLSGPEEAEKSAVPRSEVVEEPAFTGFEEAVETSATPSALSSRHSAQSQNSLIFQYWDKVGDVKLSRERLFDLDQEYEEEKALREFFRDQELEPGVDDKHFEENWLQVFANAELALVEAQAEQDLALELCRNDGLDPDADRRRTARSEIAATDSQPSREDFDLPILSEFPPPSFAEGGMQDVIRDFPKRLLTTQKGRRNRRGSKLQPLFKSSPHLNRVADWVESVRQQENALRPQSASDLDVPSSEQKVDSSKQVVTQDNPPGPDSEVQRPEADHQSRPLSQHARRKFNLRQRSSSDPEGLSRRSRADTQEWTLLSSPMSGSPRRRESVANARSELGEGVVMRQSSINRAS